MYNICLRMLNNETDAEDLLQQVFTDVFTKLHTFRFQSSIGAWIKRITVNNCINFLKKKRIQFAELNEQVQQPITEMINTTVNDSAHLDVQKIKRALFQLPDGYRIVFSLYLLEGYDHQEIANILDISVATSKSQLSRAKSKIKQFIQAQEQYN